MTGSPDPLGDDHRALDEHLQDADGLLVLLDFDGTLAPIADRPDAVALPDATRDVLTDLRDARGVRVGVVSGRGLADLRDRVGVDGLGYAGNHGLELRVDGETRHPVGSDFRSTIGQVVADVESRLADVEGAFVEDKGVTASVHYRLAPDDAVPAVERAVRSAAADADDVHVTTGKAVLELRPDVDWDKGRATRLLYDRWVPDDEVWSALYVGDDRTDEDAFRALPDAGFGVAVGHDAETAADYHVPDTDAVREALRWLADRGVDRLAADPDGRSTSRRP